jgi:hypothetical protein
MSTNPIYQYTWKSGWNIGKSSVCLQVSDGNIQNDIKNGIRKAMLESFTKKFAEIGRWFIVDSVNVNVTSFSKTLDYPYIPLPLAPCTVQAEGTTTIIFRSDATPDQEFSPQGWEEILWAILALIETAITLHGVLFFALLIIIALTFYNLAGGFTGTLFGAGAGALGTIGTIIVVAIVGVGGLLLLSSL